MPNLAALRAAVFLLSAKNRWGGTYVPPPGRARVKISEKNRFERIAFERKKNNKIHLQNFLYKIH